MAAAGNPTRAAGIQAYMKSTMPYYGVNMPELRAMTRTLFATSPMSCREWHETILQLWRGARRREERYVAQILLEMKPIRECLTPRDMTWLEEMVVTGAWWDLVDELATIIGDVLRRYPEQMRPLMRKWSTDPNLWKRRVSIICQLRFKRDTDVELLYANIEPNLADRDFFVRKAIGWALRQYAWTDPQEVARYVRENESRLNGLSKREALKNIG
ncbi:MAG TPA: DNA alkylation repair protein [Candidatus Dormibacteraeota bacterium]|nr:DNA alkylation repair protein [Candidatus Dormibacteraeota bacterium]